MCPYVPLTTIPEKKIEGRASGYENLKFYR